MRPETTPAVLPGTLLLTEIRGPLGQLVSLGQLVTGDPSPYTHVAVCVGDGTVIEAHPRGGVRQVAIEHYLDGRRVAFGWAIRMTPAQRVQIVAEARALMGARYSWLTYLWLACARFGLQPGWIRDRLSRDDQFICSTFADRAFERAGVHLFDDGRAHGLVTPGNIANRLLDADWALHAEAPA